MMKKIFYGLCLLGMYWLPSIAQDNNFFASVNEGEQIYYDINFKWGVLKRVGDGVFSFQRDRSVENAAYRYHLQFKTTKFFDSFYKMRDTLNCYYDDENRLIYSVKATEEGKYYSVDKLTFTYGEDSLNIHSYRYTPTRVRLDTILKAMGDVTDMLGAVYYMRGVDRKNLKSGDVFPLTVAIGRDLVKMQFNYKNQAIVEHGKVKYNTRYFVLDIYDEAFESAKAAAEIWIGDDDNFIPIRARSKMTIGYVEIIYRESTGLAHPLTSRIEIKKK